MNRRLQFLFLLLGLVLTTKASAQGTAFSYQGKLGDNGLAANGNYDFRFGIYNAVTNGTRISGWLTNSAVPVSNGLFVVTLDFGPGIFTGGNCWLDIAVQTNGGASFSTLSPRQPVLPVPYAIFSTGASNVLGPVPAAQVSGASTNQVTFTNVNNTFGGTFNGTFSGNGASISNLNGSQITFGTVADARLSTNVALLNTNQTFTGTNTFTGNNLFTGSNTFTGNNQFTGTNFYSGVNIFTNRGNSFVGSFFGNGLVGWIPVSGTVTQAMPDAGYLLLNAGQTTVTLPPTASLLIGDIVRISGAGAGGWLVLPNAGQSILGNFATYRASVLQLSSAGGDWRRLASSADGSRIFAGGNLANGVDVSYDDGQTWSSTSISGSGPFAVACSTDGNVVYAATIGGSIQRSLNGGASWSSNNPTANWNAIACSANGSNYLAGASAGSLVLNSGSSPPASGNWTAVACSINFTNLAASIGSTVYTSTNGGANWINATPGGVCNALAASASGFKLIAAYNGGIAVSTNFGANWTSTAPVGGNWTALAASADCTRIVAGVSNGLLYASANFGASWTLLSPNNQFWSGAACSADGTIFVAAARTIQSATGAIYYGTGNTQTRTTTNSIVGSQGSAVELQYIGNNQFMPVSSTGSLWAN